MRKGIFFAVGGAFAAAVLGVGCGSANNNEVTASSISKAQYIKKANAICEEGVKRIKTDYGVFLREHTGEKRANPTASNTQLIDTVLAPNIKREVEELRELGAPKEDVATIEAMLDAREETIVLAEEDPKSITSNKPFEKSIKAAEKYGVTACAVP